MSSVLIHRARPRPPSREMELSRERTGRCSRLRAIAGTYVNRSHGVACDSSATGGDAEDVLQETCCAMAGHPRISSSLGVLHLAVPDRGQRGQPITRKRCTAP